MKPGGGSAKGSAFERKMANELSIWYYGKAGYLWRRPGNEVRKHISVHTGDIVPVNDTPLPYPWPFHVELKHYRRGGLDLYDLMERGSSSALGKIWSKAVLTRRKDLIPMVIFKENRRSLFCMIGYTGIYAYTAKIYPELYFPALKISVAEWKYIRKSDIGAK
jgi:hypothetical protein